MRNRTERERKGKRAEEQPKKKQTSMHGHKKIAVIFCDVNKVHTACILMYCTGTVPSGFS